MRELKFRVWFVNVKRGEKKGDDIIWHTKSYYDYNPIIDNNGLLEVEGGWDIWGNSDENYVLEQYTGLKDRNGKEIYEGDIVECSFGESGAVEFRHGAYCVVGDDINDMSNWKETAFEVVGNIHENPELLEAKNVY